MEDYRENEDYKDEFNEYDEADYEYKEQEEFQVGYVHFEQLGYEREEYEVIGTSVEGDMQRLQIGILADDLGEFMKKLEEVFINFTLFNEQDKKIIKKRASTLSFIRIRSPLYFALGYYLFHNENGMYNKQLKKKELNKYFLVKYQKLWESITLLENRKMLEERLKINYTTPTPLQSRID